MGSLFFILESIILMPFNDCECTNVVNGYFLFFKKINKMLKQTITDLLAMERTKLANERTFLAYFRTFIAFLSAGFAILKIDFLKEISLLGWGFLIIAPILLVVGFARYFVVRKRLNKYYQTPVSSEEKIKKLSPTEEEIITETEKVDRKIEKKKS